MPKKKLSSCSYVIQINVYIIILYSAKVALLVINIMCRKVQKKKKNLI